MAALGKVLCRFIDPPLFPPYDQGGRLMNQIMSSDERLNAAWSIYLTQKNYKKYVILNSFRDLCGDYKRKCGKQMNQS